MEKDTADYFPLLKAPELGDALRLGCIQRDWVWRENWYVHLVQSWSSPQDKGYATASWISEMIDLGETGDE